MGLHVVLEHVRAIEILADVSPDVELNHKLASGVVELKFR